MQILRYIIVNLFWVIVSAIAPGVSGTTKSTIFLNCDVEVLVHVAVAIVFEGATITRILVWLAFGEVGGEGIVLVRSVDVWHGAVRSVRIISCCAPIRSGHVVVELRSISGRRSINSTLSQQRRISCRSGRFPFKVVLVLAPGETNEQKEYRPSLKKTNKYIELNCS